MPLSDPPRRARATIIDAGTLAAGAQVTRFPIGALSDNARAGTVLPRRRTPAGSPAPAAAPPEPPPPTPEELARAAQQAAFDRGYEQGYREGARAFDEWRAQQAEQQAAEIAARFDQALAGFSAQLAGAERQLAAQVIELAVAIARQTVRSAVAVQPERLLPVVQEAIAALVDEQARPTVHLNPDDCERVREALADVLERRGGALEADARLAPGECRVSSPAGMVDATLAVRWQRAMAAIGRDDPWIE